MERATFGAGCFWGVQSTFDAVEGVVKTRVGYMGGQTEHPTYKQVCSGKTGHAEVVEVEYDPSKVGYEELLKVFWSCHDPTQKDRQGVDIGSQYRSCIFYHDAEQQDLALNSRRLLELSGKYEGKIVTAIEPARDFYPAEEYHQKYLEKKGINSCKF